MSPDTVAWDNPFPTFPVRPKKATHEVTGNIDGPLAKHGLEHRHRVDKNGSDERPRTASSKSSSYIHTRVADDPTSNFQAPQNVYHQNSSGELRNAFDRMNEQGHPRNRTDDSLGKGIVRLEPPILAGRHSEDSRPSIHANTGFDPHYERSRTRPSAVSEIAANHPNPPKPRLQTSLPEPGANAGYYGPEDRGFTPITPVFEQDNRKQARTRDIEYQPQGHVAVEGSNTASLNHTLHTPKETLGDVLDHYYDGSPPDTQLARNASQIQPSFPMREDTSNFDHIPEAAPRSGKGTTFDKDLEPQHGLLNHPQSTASPYDRNQPYHQGNQHAAGRSRSQPNFQDRRSPRQQQHDEFNFGLPESFGRPPATAPAPGREHFARGLDTNFGSRQGPPEKFRVQRGPHLHQVGPAAAYGGSDASYSVSGSMGQSAKMYEDDGMSNRYHSPPNQVRPYRPPLGQASAEASSINCNVSSNVYPKSRPSPTVQDGLYRNRQGTGISRSPKSSSGPTSPPVHPPLNPDALPSHPVPQRQGLSVAPPFNQAPKPAPIRQYNAGPSDLQAGDPSQKPRDSPSSATKNESVSVTPQELDRLKQSIARDPNDLATQLVLAKKLVQAASDLVDEWADSRSRSKSREKYILEAYKIIKKLSGSGYSEATFYLADSYTRGALGLESDTREAFKLYQTAAKSGHAQAAYRVAVCCEIGQEEGGGTRGDPVKAMQWYKRAATLEDTPAMYKMGIISLKGLLGQPKNPREAMTWLKRAADRADRENPHALHELVSPSPGYMRIYLFQLRTC